MIDFQLDGGVKYHPRIQERLDKIDVEGIAAVGVAFLHDIEPDGIRMEAVSAFRLPGADGIEVHISGIEVEEVVAAGVFKTGVPII